MISFSNELAETAKQLGVEQKLPPMVTRSWASWRATRKLVVVDLNARSHPIRTIEMLRLVRKDCPRCGLPLARAGGPAVQAQKAGCDEVMPRSAFTQNLASILSVAKD